MKIMLTFQEIEIETNLNERIENLRKTSNNSELENNRQTSFFVDLQEATNNQTQKKKATEDPLIKSQKKRSLFSKNFWIERKR